MGRLKEERFVKIMADIRSVFERLPVHGRTLITIRGANHYLFSDDGAVLKSDVVRRTLRLRGALDIDVRRQLAVTAYAVRRFFDAHLGTEGP